MKKYKMIKSLISFMIIVAFVLPSYASISSSNGSTFITKGEVDTAMTDLKSRLTTFEAGINSKIDAQVTSYLDRNGIWNGSKQVFNTNYTYGGNKVAQLFMWTNDSGRTSWTVNAGEVNNIGFLGLLTFNCYNGWRRFPSQKYAWASYKIVEKTTKPGLCIASLKFEQNYDTTSVYTCAYLQFSGNDDGSSANEKWFLIQHMLTQEYHETTPIPGGSATEYVDSSKCIDNLPDDAFGVSNILLSEFESSSEATKNKTITVPHGTYTFMGFVRKGEPIYYAVAMIGAKANTYQLAGNNNAHTHSWYITNADITIY